MSPIVNLQLVVKCKKRSFHSFKVEVALLRYIVFYCELGCDTSEPHVSTISRACSSLVRQPYYIPNRFLLRISRLETILATKKGSLNGRIFHIDEYTLIFSSLAVHKVCTKAILLGERSVRIRKVEGSTPFESIKRRIVLNDTVFLFVFLYKIVHHSS